MGGYDVIVVGGGSAGAVLAARLTEDPARRVLLVEAGPDWRAAAAPAEIRVPAWGPSFDFARVGALHWTGIAVRQTRAQPAPVPYMRGRGLGGSSTVNGQVALRPPVADFDLWADHGALGWSGADALRLFRRLEDDLDFGDREGHGRGGPIPISRPAEELWSPLDTALRTAAADLGHPFIDDVHDPAAPARASWAIPANQRDGRRVTTNDGYLEGARDRANLEILAGTTVLEVIFDAAGRRAVGVRCRTEGAGSGSGPAAVREIHAGEVVLCAGAIGSPAILQRSGVGPEPHLAALGIDVRADLPVGEGLQDHPFIPVLLDLDPDPVHQDRPTVRCAVSYTSGLPGGAPRDMVIAAGNRVRVSEEWQLPSNLMVWQHECRSRGRLRISAADPDAPLDIDLALLSDRADLVRMRDGVRRVARLLRHDAFADLKAGAAIGDAQVRTATGAAAGAIDDMDDLVLDRIIEGQVASASHMACTCAIGSVVDGDGRVYGLGGLRVADLSIAPKIPRANTNLTAIMIGERIAEQM